MIIFRLLLQWICHNEYVFNPSLQYSLLDCIVHSFIHSCLQQPWTCDPTWLSTQWSDCSAKCANETGFQTRAVFCASKGDDGDNNGTSSSPSFSILDEDVSCDDDKRYVFR